MITKQTATDIALAYREIEAGEKLLAEVREAVDKFASKDIRDAFGRRVNGLQLGVPSGNDSTRCFNVPYTMAIPILEAHIANQRAEVALLCEKARIELVPSIGGAA